MVAVLRPLCWFRPSPRELVVHSPKWSTGSRLFPAFDPVSASSLGASGPLAPTFSGLLTQFRPPPRELVVHSTEWSTGSRLFRAFDPVSAPSQGASGPLDGVVH